jgi:hypothetical protein
MPRERTVTVTCRRSGRADWVAALLPLGRNYLTVNHNTRTNDHTRITTAMQGDMGVGRASLKRRRALPTTP